VNPETCAFRQTPKEIEEKYGDKLAKGERVDIHDVLEDRIKEDKANWKSKHWGKLTLTIFSLPVASSIFASLASSPSAFYSLVLLTIGAYVRP